MLSWNFRYYALLAISAVSVGIALFWIDRAVEQRDWLGQYAFIGLGLILFAAALMAWGDKWLGLASTDQNITPSEGSKK
ncbi:hypothetical protein [Sphingomonas hylomeconis]|uniref:Uncharacterized protein n=1 Tax=Sphingomonas hylomeconis TaxID=1395958 RepID=A0ABV7T3C9_9SPHN|nr:hypothetical protein [Sphingomonas hylomeconis]